MASFPSNTPDMTISLPLLSRSSPHLPSFYWFNVGPRCSTPLRTMRAWRTPSLPVIGQLSAREAVKIGPIPDLALARPIGEFGRELWLRPGIEPSKKLWSAKVWR